MKNPTIQLYYDREGDYLELTFGEPTPAIFVKSAADTFARVDRETGDTVGYAVFNVMKGGEGFKIVELPIPASSISEVRKAKSDSRLKPLK